MQAETSTTAKKKKKVTVPVCRGVYSPDIVLVLYPLDIIISLYNQKQCETCGLEK